MEGNGHTKKISIPTIILDVILLVLAWIPIGIFKAAVIPYHRGFYCDDESIRYPYHDSTVDQKLLYGLAFGIPMALIFIVEAFRLFYVEKRMKGELVLKPIHRIGQKNVHPYVSRLYLFLGVPLGIDTWIPSPAPGFVTLTIFRYPDPEQLIGIDLPTKNYYQRLSFPSGHASTSFYGMVFSVLYLEARASAMWISNLLRPCVQLILLSMAVFTALSRVSDYKHHPTDVLSGSILGVIVALIVGIGVCRLFRPRSWLVVDEEGRRYGRSGAALEGIDEELHVRRVEFSQNTEDSACPAIRPGPGQV